MFASPNEAKHGGQWRPKLRLFQPPTRFYHVNMSRNDCLNNNNDNNNNMMMIIIIIIIILIIIIIIIL